MNIKVNGETRQVPERCTAQQLVELLALGEQRVAMEVNMEIIPRGSYPTHQLVDGDNVELVRAIGGGSW